MSDTALARLVGDPAAFRSRFGREPFHLPHADPDGFADLLSLNDVDHVVASTGLRAPAFRLVRDGVTLPRSTVTRRARIGSQPVDDLVDVAAVHREFAAGATVVLQGLHRSWAPVAALCRELEASLTHPVQANAYLTPPVAQGLHLHADAHDVFAVQTYGTKRWVVHPAADADPLDLELVAGDVLYLPAGVRHAAQTVDQPSLHLTLGVRTVRWHEVVDRVVEEALEDPAFDAALPAGWADDPERLAAELRERLRELGLGLIAAADDVAAGDPATGDGAAEGALRAAAQQFWGARRPDLAGGLQDLLEIAHLDDTTPLRRRPASTCRLVDHGDRLDMQLVDRRLTVPAELAPVLRRMLDLDAFAPKELDELIDEPSRLVLCRRLVREGLLAVDRPRDRRRG